MVGPTSARRLARLDDVKPSASALDPFGTSTGLAGTAATEKEPGAPRFAVRGCERRGELFVAGPNVPVEGETFEGAAAGNSESRRRVWLAVREAREALRKILAETLRIVGEGGAGVVGGLWLA